MVRNDMSARSGALESMVANPPAIGGAPVSDEAAGSWLQLGSSFAPTIHMPVSSESSTAASSSHLANLAAAPTTTTPEAVGQAIKDRLTPHFRYNFNDDTTKFYCEVCAGLWKENLV